MKALLAFLAFLGVAAVGALVAVLLIVRNPADSGPGQERVASASTAAPSPSPMSRKSVLVDVEGAVIEEFSGDCADSGYPYLCRYVSERLVAEDPRLLAATA
ncbi:hypothetical protein ACFQX6_64100 [Streptosporangium lutulentum]